jgi:hypothetical protein
MTLTERTQKVFRAWKTAQKSRDFYAKMEELLGIPPKEMVELFNRWNKLPRFRVEEIALESGVGLKEAGFAAYLAHVGYGG